MDRHQAFKELPVVGYAQMQQFMNHGVFLETPALGEQIFAEAHPLPRRTGGPLTAHPLDPDLGRLHLEPDRPLAHHALELLPAPLGAHFATTPFPVAEFSICGPNPIAEMPVGCLNERR